MSKSDYQKWADENVVSSEHRCYNGIDYIFATLKDGWIAISEVDSFGIYPCIQAKDVAHAENWCVMRERVNVPMQSIC